MPRTTTPPTTDIVDLQLNKGIAMVDIVREIHPWLFRMSLPPKTKVELVEKLSDIEHRLAYGTSERLQLGALVAAFTKAREEIAKAAV